MNEELILEEEMYLTRTAGIETKKMFDEIMQGNQCILPALRELKPGVSTIFRG